MPLVVVLYNGKWADTYQVKEILICCSSTGNRKSNSSSWP